MPVPTTTEQMEATVARLAARLTPEDREVLEAWVAIPNIPDTSPYVLGLRDRYGRERVHRVNELLETARRALGVRYEVLQPVAQRVLGVQPVS